jgi:hypothetical protein
MSMSPTYDKGFIWKKIVWGFTNQINEIPLTDCPVINFSGKFRNRFRGNWKFRNHLESFWVAENLQRFDNVTKRKQTNKNISSRWDFSLIGGKRKRKMADLTADLRGSIVQYWNKPALI